MLRYTYIVCLAFFVNKTYKYNFYNCQLLVSYQAVALLQPLLCEASYVLLEYARTAMFMWMFIEGLYLHNMITGEAIVFFYIFYLFIYLFFFCEGALSYEAVSLDVDGIKQKNFIHIFLIPTYYTIFIINISAPISFGHEFWRSSGSYKFVRRIKRI